MNKVGLFTVLMALFSQVGFSQDFDKTKLDSYFDTLETHNNFMGSVAVSKDGKLIYTRSVGFADVENAIEADKETKYRIGSISKTFTAVLVFKAIEKGIIDLDQTIEKFFPDILNADKIKVSHLLYHRSGIHNFTNDEDYLTWNTQPKTEKEMLDIIEKAGSDFEPGSQSEYSNSNYVLLTYMLESSLEKPYSELIEEYITKPLGLTNTYLGGKINIDNNESYSYKYLGDWKQETETDISIPMGAGGIVSTPIDLVKFSDALFGGELVQKESLEQMKTINGKYGIGIFQIPFYDEVAFGHTGGIDGFSSIFSGFPDQNISYALTSNGTKVKNNDISVAVLSAVFNKPYEIPEFKTYELSTEDLDKYLGVYKSPDLPSLAITFTKENKTLIAQAEGQPEILLEAIEKDKFTNHQFGVTIEFNPSKKTMILKQAGGEYQFSRE